MRDITAMRRMLFRSSCALGASSLIPGLRSHGTSADDSLDAACDVPCEREQVLTNWSATHSSRPSRVYYPRDPLEVQRVLTLYDQMGAKIRPIGTVLSPNGLAMPAKAGDADNPSFASSISMVNMDDISIDTERMEVTVGAGATVDKILIELSKRGLTLENFSSIKEQQIAGWTQVSAHGTGCTLPPVEEMIVRMKIASPSQGLLTLSRNENAAELFDYCKVGLGSLGVVTEMTLKCIPKLCLFEQSFVSERNKVFIGHLRRLRSYRHVRYMWIPYTDSVVVVVSSPSDDCSSAAEGSAVGGCCGSAHNDSAMATKSFRNLLLAKDPTLSMQELQSMPFSSLRERLLEMAPFDLAHIKSINAAEAEYWKASAGTRLADSTDILGFDCGGQQLVYEVCIPMGSLYGPDSSNSVERSVETRDIQFVKRLLSVAEEAGVAAPPPIEQRWTARSTAPLSPAYSANEVALIFNITYS